MKNELKIKREQISYINQKYSQDKVLANPMMNTPSNCYQMIYLHEILKKMEELVNTVKEIKVLADI